MSVTASLQSKGKMPAAFLVGHNQSEWNDGAPSVRSASEPALTLTEASSRQRAFIVRSSDHRENCNIARDAQVPIWTLTEGNTSHARIKAFVVDCQDAGAVNEDGARGVTVRHGDAPMFTVPASVNESSQKRPIRAFIFDGQNASRLTVSPDREPTYTVTDQSKAYGRAWLEQGRVVAMTPRALARFQTIPDEYPLPDKAGLACKIIGNAVPPLFAKALCEGIAK
jgi:site-specific DNA-cytosine methylase